MTKLTTKIDKRIEELENRLEVLEKYGISRSLVIARIDELLKVKELLK